MANEAARLRGISHANRPDPGPPPSIPSDAEERTAADADMPTHLAALQAAAETGRNRATLDLPRHRQAYIDRVIANLEEEGFTVRRRGRTLVSW